MNASLAAKYDAAEVFEDAGHYMGQGSQSAPVWSKPDMTVLAGGRTAPPDMPQEMFGKLWPLVRDLAAGAGAPAEYVAVSILAVAASTGGYGSAAGALRKFGLGSFRSLSPRVLRK